MYHPLYNNKYMIASTQILKSEIFVYKQKRQQTLLNSRLLFKKITNFTGKLLQNYKQLECEIFRKLLKHYKPSFISAFSIFPTHPPTPNFIPTPPPHY